MHYASKGMLSGGRISFRFRRRCTKSPFLVGTPVVSAIYDDDLGEEGGGGGRSGEVVDGHVTIGQPGSHHLGVGRVTVQTHHSTVGVENILGVGGVLQGVETDVATLRLLVEIIRPVADSCSKQVSSPLTSHL